MRDAIKSLVVLGCMAAVWCASAAGAQTSGVTVVIDTSEAEAVLQAVQNPLLTNEQAMAIAKLPGSQGLIRKALSYDRPASDALFARALVAAAHHEADFDDSSQFHFNAVRDDAAQTTKVLAAFNDATKQLLTQAKARIAMFTPAYLHGTVTGHLVVGGAAYGFAFSGEPAMYLDLEHVKSATLATTILEHELFHSVQMLAMLQHPTPAEVKACVEHMPHGTDIEGIDLALSMEGTASFVGDLLALPEQGMDEATSKEREDFAQIVTERKRHITQLELAVHGLATNAAVTWQDVYAAGFNGDQPFYGIGYVMAKAIARAQGDAAIAGLIDQSGAVFVLRYVNLSSYGKDSATPALGKETVLWARQIASCEKAATP